MMNRFRLMVFAIPLLALTVACSTSDAPAVQEPPAADEVPQDMETPNVDSQTAEGDTDAASTGLAGATPDTEVAPATTTGHVWDDPVVNGDEIQILLSLATTNDHVHFEVPLFRNAAEFVGYFAEGEFVVRATMCPACGEEAVDWIGDRLSCSACEATFNAATGAGENGGPGYPEGYVPPVVSGDTITMSLNDLQQAYAPTASGEQTPFEFPDESPQDTESVPLPPCCAG